MNIRGKGKTFISNMNLYMMLNKCCGMVLKLY